MKTISGSRKDRHLVRLGIFLITIALVAGVAGCFYTPPSKNLEIRTWYDLDAVWNNLAGHHTLMNDLDSTTSGYEELASPRANEGRGWEPIGITLIQHHGLTTFVGTFDGQGYEIRDLFINRPDEDAVGLFGYVGQGGVIKDIGVVNATVTGGPYVGIFGIVGGGGRIEDIGVVNATVTGDDCVGGLVGHNFYGTVSNSYSIGTVTGNHSVGGLVGFIDRGTLSKCYAMGKVAGDSGVGGLVGDNYEGTVSDSFWDTETSGQASSDGGTGKTTAEMRDTVTFLDADWNIVAVADSGTRNTGYVWNIVDGQTYPFLSWQPV
jgi:hypothetical protein